MLERKQKKTFSKLVERFLKVKITELGMFSDTTLTYNNIDQTSKFLILNFESEIGHLFLERHRQSDF